MTNRRFELFEYRQVLDRMRQGDSDRDIGRSGLMGRKKLTAVRRMADERGWLNRGQLLADDTVIAGVFGRIPHLPSTCVSTLKLGARVVRAGFGLGKTLETFNFDRLPKLNCAHIHDLATGRYIDEKVAVLMVGQTGVGKAHIAQAWAAALHVRSVPLLIVDDFALKPLRAPHDEDFHDSVAARYKRAATILTSNLALSESGDAFPRQPGSRRCDT